uniref:Uncharacterized protein n=1 Tax=Physcomitrium patens TaxID=3218 RepID=A0A2K1KP78_PHYPA|nr:hypothetical protein PHYPA_006486 [Physcomitrium patens]
MWSPSSFNTSALFLNQQIIFLVFHCLFCLCLFAYISLFNSIKTGELGSSLPLQMWVGFVLPLLSLCCDLEGLCDLIRQNDSGFR